MKDVEEKVAQLVETITANQAAGSAAND